MEAVNFFNKCAIQLFVSRGNTYESDVALSDSINTLKKIVVRIKAVTI